MKNIKSINQEDTRHPEMRLLLLELKKQELGALRCEICGSNKGKAGGYGLELHHKRYGLDVTYYDLELLCWSCHKNRHAHR